MLDRLRPSALLLAATLSLAACAEGALTGGGFGDDGGDSAFAEGSPQDPTSIAYFNQTVGDRVFFEVDQSSLTESAQAVLVTQAGWLLANPGFTAIIEGHADERGTTEYNLALGARRAAAVRDFLATQGVPDNRMRTVTYGKERPVEICSEESCYSQNRRSVTVLSAGLGS